MASPNRPQEKWIAHRDKIDKTAPQWPEDVGIDALIPALDIALDDKVLGESNSRGVRTHGAAVPEQLVPVRAGEVPAPVAELGIYGFVPHSTIADVGEELDGVVAGVAEDVEGALHSCT